MRHLQHLSIKRNRISRIYPGAFENLTSLLDLQLDGNRIISMPQLSGMPNLNRLGLANNRIVKLEYSFRKLPALTEIHVSVLLLLLLNRAARWPLKWF